MAVTIKLQTYHILYNKIRPASKQAPGEMKKKEKGKVKKIIEVKKKRVWKKKKKLLNVDNIKL